MGHTDGSHVVYVAKELGWLSARDALIHEWAHALARTPGHSRAWGQKYALLYRQIHEA